ncbi:MAG: PEP-utilizing enzyme [Desulfobacteraceae bacterium]|nr:PEP-utilizing enzyme [Desulfobacteraceae bacterium]
MRELIKKIAALLPGRAASGPRRLDLKELFHLFQAVLATNNQALSIITDLGEKLSGNYIFDTKYLQEAHRELTGAIEASLANFTLLTGGQYQIAPAFTRINSLISFMLTGQGETGAELILPLARLPWDRGREVGGKNFHLAELKNTLNLPIPDGFAITSRAFDEFIRHNHLQEAINFLGDSPAEGELAALRHTIQAGEPSPGLKEGIERALAELLLAPQGRKLRLAVRSSAEEEDDLFSFAGQFETVLNVPPTGEAVGAAYRTVLASLFSPGAVEYQRRLGYRPGTIKMPVGCLAMIEAAASGVMYTADPVSGDREQIIVNAAWGYGPSVVDGATDPDLYRIAKGEPPRLLAATCGQKRIMSVLDPALGIKNVATPEEQRARACLSQEQALTLAGWGQTIESYFKGPQDVEWSLDQEGQLHLLQARPLTVEGGERPADGPAPDGGCPLLMRDTGLVVRRGIAAGKAFVVRHPSDLDAFPKGAVLVAEHDSPQFVRVLPYVSAIITDIGALASHMASVCREFKIPTLVNTGQATSLIRHGQEITLECDDEGKSRVYDGLDPEVLARRKPSGAGMEELFEFRRKKYILRYISPLNLVNPLVEEFSPERCRTLHDVLRFLHEKSIQQIIDSARAPKAKGQVFQLTLTVPVVIRLVDLGGGVAAGTGPKIGQEQVASRPLAAIIKGLTTPGAWRTGQVAMSARDLLSGIARAQELTASGGVDNFAGISREYVNLGLRFGYHFNLIDSYCCERAANNHLYFRFVGGAADLVKRSRRLQMMELVLAEYGFMSKSKGDFLIARVSHLEQDELLRLLEMAGRLVAFTRQLDAELANEEDIGLYAKRFLAGDF